MGEVLTLAVWFLTLPVMLLLAKPLSTDLPLQFDSELLRALRPEEPTVLPGSNQPSKAAIDFMKQFMGDEEDRSGKSGSSVWCFMDTAASDSRSTMTENKCMDEVTYAFGIAPLFQSSHFNTDGRLNISKAILRVYIDIGHFQTIKVNITLNASIYSPHGNSDAVAATYAFDISRETSGWQELTVTEELKQMFALAPDSTQQVGQFTVSASVHCDSQGNTPIKTDTALDTRPQLVVFFPTDETSSNNPTRRNVPAQMPHPQDGNEEEEGSSADQSCATEDFSIIFADLGFTNVLVPFSANIRKCTGFCSPSSSTIRQYIFDLIGQSTETVACCVPTEYRSLTVLLWQQNDSLLEYRRVPNLVVETCGCA